MKPSGSSFEVFSFLSFLLFFSLLSVIIGQLLLCYCCFHRFPARVPLSCRIWMERPQVAVKPRRTESNAGAKSTQLDLSFTSNYCTITATARNGNSDRDSESLNSSPLDLFAAFVPKLPLLPAVWFRISTLRWCFPPPTHSPPRF